MNSTAALYYMYMMQYEHAFPSAGYTEKTAGAVVCVVRKRPIARYVTMKYFV